MMPSFKLPRLLLCIATIGLCPVFVAVARSAALPVQLHWLEQPTAGTARGVSWGVPWPQGAVARDANFNLTDSQGKILAVQTWPLAYWPDGSLKWSGLAAVTSTGLTTGTFTLTPASAAAAPATAGKLRVTTGTRAFIVDTGAMTCTLPFTGENLI